MPGVDQVMETRPLWSESSVLFDWEEWPSMKPKPNDGDYHNRIMTIETAPVYGLELSTESPRAPSSPPAAFINRAPATS
jgi:hypothetical protein